MGTAMHPSATPKERHHIAPEVRVALVTAVCLIAEAVIAKNVLEVQLDWFSQMTPFWVYIAYMVSGLRDRTSELWFIAAIVASTIAVLVLYAV